MKVFLDNVPVPAGQLIMPKNGDGRSILQVGDEEPIKVWVYMSESFDEDHVQKTYMCYRRKPVDFTKGKTVKVTVTNVKAKANNKK
jgi:hypothetical protein